MELINKNYKFKLITKPSQEEVFDSWFGTCRFLYNLGLEHRILHWSQWRSNQNYYDQANQLKEMKKVEGFEWIGETPSQVLQQSLKDLDKAFRSFWRSGFGFPKWKKKSGNQSIRFPDAKSISVRRVSKRKAFVKLPKIGEVGFRLSQPILGKIKNCTVKKETDGLYITFCTEQELSHKKENENRTPIGIDRGITETIVTSEGQVFKLPNQCKKYHERIKILQKRLRKQKKFSNNWQKSQEKIRKLHTKIARARLDFLHKTSTELVKKHDYIKLEDLKIKNMSKSAKGTIQNPGKNVASKSGLNREILLQGWGIFATQLAYKTTWNHGHLELVNPRFTSQRCSKCGYRDPRNRKGKTFGCLNCGHKEDADLNAAKNINNSRAGLVRCACGDANNSLIDEARTSEKVA